MRRWLYALLLAAAGGCAFAGQVKAAPASGPTADQAPVHTLTGDFVTIERFRSKFLAADRTILIFLPAGYDVNSHVRYPVLYMQDGQNLFDGATSFIPGHEWRMDETATALIAARTIRPLIIVGIYNTGLDRIDEYTPSRSKTAFFGQYGGDADNYGRMLVTELRPYVDRHFRTLTDPADTGLGGSSLGGLVSLYLGLKYPDVFGKLACLSPSAWWDNEWIVKRVLRLKSTARPRIWLDTGTAEGYSGDGASGALDSVRDLRDALVAKGWREGKDLDYDEVPGAQHNEDAWAKRVAPMLTFLFPAH